MSLRKIIAVIVTVSFAINAEAQDISKTFNDWYVGIISGDEGIFAATVNDSGGVFGEYCYKSTGRCLWLLSNNIGCKNGNNYPILANADTGAFTSVVTCLAPTPTQSRYKIDYKIIEPGIQGASNIGFAYPMKGGQFQVSRFSLYGAAQAIQYMESIAKHFGEQAIPDSSNTRDQRL